MVPLWSGQGTVPHATVSDLLSTDVLVSVPGTPVGTKRERERERERDRQTDKETDNKCNNYTTMFIPAVRVEVIATSDCLLTLPTAAITLKLHTLPGSSPVTV